jgi:uroporphyrinogen decarboxylase
LLADWTAIGQQIQRIVDEGRAASGHVFNLGHGVLPSTDPEVLARVVDTVHSATP